MNAMTPVRGISEGEAAAMMQAQTRAVLDGLQREADQARRVYILEQTLQARLEELRKATAENLSLTARIKEAEAAKKATDPISPAMIEAGKRALDGRVFVDSDATPWELSTAAQEVYEAMDAARRDDTATKNAPPVQPASASAA